MDWSETPLGDCLWHWGAFQSGGDPLGGFIVGFVEDTATNSIRLTVGDYPGGTWGVGFANAPQAGGGPVSGTAGPEADIGVQFPFEVAFTIDRDEWPTAGRWRAMPYLYVNGVNVWLGTDLQSGGFEIEAGNARLYSEGGPEQAIGNSGLLHMRFEFLADGWHLHYSEDGSTWGELGTGPLAYEGGATFTGDETVVFYGKLWTLSGGEGVEVFDVAIYELAITAEEDDFPACVFGEVEPDPDPDPEPDPDAFTYTEDFSEYGLGDCLWTLVDIWPSASYGSWSVGAGGGLRFTGPPQSELNENWWDNPTPQIGSDPRVYMELPVTVTIEIEDLTEWVSAGVRRIHVPPLSSAGMGDWWYGFDTYNDQEVLMWDGAGSQGVDVSAASNVALSWHFEADVITLSVIADGAATSYATDQAAGDGPIAPYFWVAFLGDNSEFGISSISITADEADFPECALVEPDPDPDPGPDPDPDPVMVTYVEDWSVYEVGDCFWHTGSFQSADPIGGFTGREFVASPPDAIRLQVPDASNTWGIGFTNTPTLDDLGNGYGLTAPFTVELDLERAQWPVGFWLRPHMYRNGSHAVYFTNDPGAGFRNNGGQLEVYANGGSAVAPVGATGMLSLRFEVLLEGYHFYFREEGGTWEEVGIGPHPWNFWPDPGTEMDPTDVVAFYGKVWTGNDPADAVDLDVSVYNLAITAKLDEFPECADVSAPEVPMPAAGLVGLGALALALAGFADARRLRKRQ